MFVTDYHFKTSLISVGKGGPHTNGRLECLSLLLLSVLSKKCTKGWGPNQKGRLLALPENIFMYFFSICPGLGSKIGILLFVQFAQNDSSRQGTLTEGEGLVQLTSSLGYLVL